jgi:hypothetical protein
LTRTLESADYFSPGQISTAHCELAQVQCAQRLIPSPQTLQIRGNGPLQSLAFMQACGFDSACAPDEMPAATIATTTAEKTKRS